MGHDQESGDLTALNSTVYTLGSYLRSCRESKGMILSDISRRTKILTTILRELENDNFAKLPGPTYLKGFVKAFAREVEANEEYALQLLDQAMGRHIPHHKSAGSESESALAHSDEVDEEIQSPQINIIALFRSRLFWGIFTLIAVVTYPIYHIIYVISSNDLTTSFNRETFPTTTSVGAPPKDPTKLVQGLTKGRCDVDPENCITQDPNALVVKGVADKDMNLADPSADAAAEAVLNKPVDGATEEFSQVDSSLYRAEALKEGEWKEIYPDYIRERVSQSSKENLFVYAQTGDCWLRFQVDNGPVRTFTLKAGKHVLIQGKLIKFFLGNLAGTRLIYNNKVIKMNGAETIRSFVFPASAATQYRLPLFLTLVSGDVITSEEYLKAPSKYQLMPKSSSADETKSEPTPISN